jgi:alkylation response protein AidB-like acyl-CoA dehydrogenase
MHDADFLAALRINAFEVLADQSPIDRVHHHIDGDEPFDASLWKTVSELGWPMLAVPEAQGGMANGMAAPALVQEAIGAHCAPLPFIGTNLLATALSGWHDTDFAGWLAADVADGSLIGGACDMTESATISAHRAADGFALSGEVALLDALGSQWIVLQIRDAASGEPGLALIETASLSPERRPVADRTRTVATERMVDHSVAERQVMFGANASVLADRLRQLALLLVAADAFGGGAALLASTVEYLKTRIQFGKPIGSFQALKHRVADCRTDLEMARSLLTQAREQAEGAQGLTLAAMAKASACEAYDGIACEAVQMHGGIGYTWEHHAHIYLKRATLNRALCGGPAQVRDLIASRLLEQSA